MLIAAAEIGVIIYQQRSAHELAAQKHARTIGAPSAHPPTAKTSLAENTPAENEDAGRLREKLVRLQQAWARTTGPSAPPALEPGMTSPESWSNAGTASPPSALSTLLWATSHERMDTLSHLYTFSERSRLELDNLFASLSEEERRAYGTPERLFAGLNSRRRGFVPPLKIVSEQRDPAEAYLRTEVQLPSGAVHEGLTYHFSRQADEWKLVIGDGEINQLKTTLRGVPPAQRKHFSSD
jgi:hypothetical protein